MIYLTKQDGTIQQYEDNMMQALRTDVELHEQRGEKFGEIYTADSLPDIHKLALGLITQSELDAKQKETRIMQIKGELADIDTQTIRPLRAKIAGTATTTDENKLSELEAEAVKLRTELKSLE